MGTLVFDEIDEGVSGIAAQRVAEKLARLARKKQVICVTHLAQIAAMADNHLYIVKREEKGKTFTDVMRAGSCGARARNRADYRRRRHYAAEAQNG